MNKINKILSACSAAAVLSVVCAGSLGSLGTVAAESDNAAIALVNDMGMGWNLGNTFDCWNTSSYTDDNETGWGNPKTTQAMIDGIKSAGFKSVRIPITWYENTDSTNYDIDDAYLARIKEVIDYCYANDLYVIINMHWDWESGGSLWLNQGLGAKTQFVTMWKEIANYFKDYDNHLVFEDMNEVTFDYSVLNELNASFVNIVRSTGGNNANRLLLLAGKNADFTDTCNSQFVLPDDDMLAVDLHYYSPPQWCVATKGTSWGYYDTWGTDSDVQAVYNDFNRVKQYFVDNGVPVIVGEYGVLTNDYKDKTDITEYLNTVAAAALNIDGISAFLWDSGNCGDMQFFDRKTLSWFDPNVEAVYSKLSTGDIEIPEGLMLTDKVSYTPELMEVLDDGYNIDLKPYKELGVNLKTVVIEGSVSNKGTDEAYGVGGAVAFAAKQNGDSTGSYTAENWFLNAGDTSHTVSIDGELTDDEGNVTATYELEYDYLNIVKWWDWSDPNENKDKDISYSIDKVTLIFDQKFYINDDGTVIVPEEPTTEPTTEPDTTTEPTTEPDTTTEPVSDVKYGDADLSGEINVNDVVAIMCYSSDPDRNGFTDEQINAADVFNRGDGVNSSDAVSIQKYLAKILSALPESYKQ